MCANYIQSQSSARPARETNMIPVCYILECIIIVYANILTQKYSTLYGVDYPGIRRLPVNFVAEPNKAKPIHSGH